MTMTNEKLPHSIKARPIPFSGPMVRALLAGTKTQTRRVVSKFKGYPAGQENQPMHIDLKSAEACGNGTWKFTDSSNGHGNYAYAECPYGQPGDRLWVREAWKAVARKCGCYTQPCDCTTIGFTYLADNTTDTFDDYDIGEWQPTDMAISGKKRPPMFMPHFASRILLEVVSVRVERLQRISGADAVAEGIELIKFPGWVGDTSWKNYLTDESHCPHPVDSYSTLWESINGPGSWEANPWVWVVEFKVLQPEPATR